MFGNQKYHDHWLFLIENFTPIIPTVSKSLAGSWVWPSMVGLARACPPGGIDLPGADRYYQFRRAYRGVANSFNYDQTF